ncbi:MAG TPA: B12-binding domain-containing radical SAM protein [Nitrospinae bacterium]|nr:B12-binding domain-containing radical SAM protein [Nitrospinota bacterium]
MKVSISYPPLESEKGIPLLGQNRQFQWFSEPTYIYPMVPAYAATLLKENGYDVLWDDAIAEGFTYTQWLERIRKEKPDIIAIETKTPVIKRHWKIIDDLKRLATGNWPLVTVLIGDHVTALPEESMLNSQIDFVLTGGDYDFLLLNLCKQLTARNSQPATGLAPGIWYRDAGTIKNSGRYELNNDLNSLPYIDRELTKWKLYSEKNGNYKYLPGTYTMAARDCWWGRCSFCSWTTIFPGAKYRTRTPEKMLDEVGMLVEKYGVREIMDDSGTFPVGEWLMGFCNGMIKRGYNKRVKIDCNMRFGILGEEEYKMMAKAGFRFILFGLESANQKTLDRIDKNLNVKKIAEGVKFAKEAGLDPHITVMMGYPWETKDDARKTIELAQYLFKCGYIDTLQATIVIPYPGTPLFDECKKNGWLLTEDWDRYDMREPIMSSPISGNDIKELTQMLYKSFISPHFFIRKVLAIRGADDFRFFWRAGKKIVGHLADFSHRKSAKQCYK